MSRAPAEERQPLVEQIEQSGVPLDWALALSGGFISYYRLSEELAVFFARDIGRSQTVADLYLTAFGRSSQEVLLTLGVTSGAAIGYIAARLVRTLIRLAFPEIVRQVTEDTPPPPWIYRLPPWPEAREAPQFVVGEEHEANGRFCAKPEWHTIPLKGLVGSVLVVGAPGSAKTIAAVLPFIAQMVEYRTWDSARKVALFVLDRKGSLSAEVRKIAQRYGRSRDVVVLRLGGPRLNLLSDDLPPQSIAAALVAVVSLRQSSANHDEPEWIKSGIYRIFWHGIAITRQAFGSVTLRDLCKLLSGPLRADAPADDPNAVPEALDKELDRYAKAFQKRLTQGVYPDAPAAQEEFDFHTDYFERQFVRMNARNKATLIDAALDLVEPFASPELAATFCPGPAETDYPGMSTLLESGHIVVFEPDDRLGFAAITIAILLKLEFQRAAMGRLNQAKLMGEEIERLWCFVADEYQSFVTVGGGSGVEGDDSFVALSREALIANLFATQSLAGLQARIGEPRLRTLLGAIRTKLFLTLTDPNDCQLASRLAGETYRQVKSTSFTESNRNARLNPITDTLHAGSTTVSEQQSHREELRPDFLPVAFSRLETFEAIACTFDGERQRAPVKLYLKPAFLPRELPHNQRPPPVKPKEAP